MFYQQLLAESKHLSFEIEQITKELSKYPDGALCCSKNGKYIKWFHSIQKKRLYISQHNQTFLSQMAHKQYLLWMLENLKSQKHAIDSLLNSYPNQDISVDLFLADNPAFSSLFSSTRPFTPPSFSEVCTNWLSAPYIPNPMHPENLIHSSISGRKLRSKSEALIDSFLYSTNIPSKYEAPLVLGNVTIYPDFTLFHPVTGRIKYWEHFGLMDDPIYRQKASQKIDLYLSHEIIPNIDLIITTETKSNPLSIAKIQNIITEFLN